MTTITNELREYMRELGRKGGSVKSERKAAASKANGKRRKTATERKVGRPRGGKK